MYIVILVIRVFSLHVSMGVKYTWILLQEKNCRQFRLQNPLAIIGRAIYSEEWDGK